MKEFFTAAALFLLFAAVAQTLDSADAQTGTRPVPATPVSPPRDRTQTSGSQSDSTLKPNDAGTDVSFFRDGAQGGLAEVAAGHLASRQAADPQVKQFAQQMVKDHTQANQELQALARNKGVTLPTAPDAQHQQALQELQSKQGAGFDQAYVKGQLTDHKDAVSLFETASKSTDPEVSAFAQRALPVLRHHLEMVEQLQRGSGT